MIIFNIIFPLYFHSIPFPYWFYVYFYNISSIQFQIYFFWILIIILPINLIFSNLLIFHFHFIQFKVPFMLTLSIYQLFFLYYILITIIDQYEVYFQFSIFELNHKFVLNVVVFWFSNHGSYAPHGRGAFFGSFQFLLHITF